MIAERVRDVMSDLFGVPRDAIDAHASPKTIPQWDSLQHLNLVLALEQEFEIQFSTEEISAMTDFTQVVETVEQRLAQP
ncbi:MAG: acyl carrier protein [Chloroflexota bacterium]|nr:MAG: acyl carrier protein [Chloroflexota bacterium]